MRDQDDETDFGNSRSVDDLLFKLCTQDTERRTWLDTSRAECASHYDAFPFDLEFPMPSTPLYFSSYYGLYGMTKRLLDHGQDVNVEVGIYGAPLHASCWGGHSDVARLLLDHGAEINRKSHSEGITALHFASERGDASLVRLLLDRGAIIHIQDGYGESPLVLACQSGDLETMELLLDHGASIEPADSSCHAPLVTAIIYQRYPAIKLLLDRGADIDRFSWDCVDLTSALHYCAENGQTETAALLLDRGANIDIENSEGVTPLKMVVQYQMFEMVKLLVDRGASVFVRDKEGLTPLEYFQKYREEGHEIIAILTKAEEEQRRKYSTEPNQQDSTGSGSVSDVTTKAEETQESI